MEDACDLAREALRRDPTCARAFSTLGVIRAQQGEFREAADLLAKSLERSDSAVVRNNLGLVLQNMGRLAEALSSYEKALALAPDYALALNNMESAFAALKRHGEATDRYEKALKIDPVYVEALINLGVTFHALGRHEDAVERFESALRVRPDQVEARLNLGHALVTLERYPEAIGAYEAVVQARPEDPRIHLLLADAFRLYGRPVEARQCYQAALKLAPDLAPAHGGLAIACLELGRLAEAESHIERALDLDPRRPGYFQTLGRLRTIKPDDRYLDALLALDQHLQDFSPQEAVDRHFALGKALSDLGRNSEAFDHLVAGGLVGYTSNISSSAPEAGPILVRLEDPAQTGLVHGEGDTWTYANTQTTLYQAALHEIGHVIGLSEASDPSSVMFPLLGQGNAGLGATDLRLVHALYPMAGPSTATGDPAALLVQAMASFGATPSSASASLFHLPPAEAHILAASALH